MSLRFTQTLDRRDLITDALQWLRLGKRIALVTLINIEGSAPYPLGSQMLVASDGEYKGQITGGCAEQAIADQAVAAMDKGVNDCQRYGQGSPFFDIQLPCGSGIDVFIDVAMTEQQIQSMASKLEQREVVEQCINANGIDYVKRYQPNQRLILVGQGPILLSAHQLALASGFDVLSLAQNEWTLSQANTLGVDVIKWKPSIDLASLCDAYTGVGTLFHEHEHETSILKQAVNTDAFYIGALGSRKTHQRRIQALSEMGCSEQQLARIHGPVGVDIHAQTPSQIALSLVAQAVEFLNA